eukprot:360856-Chlamydomonas_euryale.AAC.2
MPRRSCRDGCVNGRRLLLCNALTIRKRDTQAANQRLAPRRLRRRHGPKERQAEFSIHEALATLFFVPGCARSAPSHACVACASSQYAHTGARSITAACAHYVDCRWLAYCQPAMPCDLPHTHLPHPGLQVNGMD